MKGDNLNPILVKELRQSARSRTLIVLVVLTLLACGILTLRTLGARPNGYESPGHQLFEALYLCLCLVGFLVVPFLAHRSLAREQEEGAWELLQLTGLGPRRILIGKLASTLVVGAIFTAVVAPFFVVSSVLGGFGPRALVRLALYGTATTGALSIATLFAAALPVTRAQRTGMQLAVLVGLVFSLGVAFRVLDEVVTEQGFIWRGPTWEHDGFWQLACELGVVGACAILFEAAVARLSLPTERYARGPRIAIMLMSAGIVAFGLRCWLVTGDMQVIEAAVTLNALLGFVAALGFAADQDRARGRGAKDHALFRPGAVAGLRFVAGLIAVPTALWLGISLSHGGMDAAAIVAAPSYVLIYTSAALLLCRGPQRLARFAAPDIVRGVAVLLVMACGVLPVAATTAAIDSNSVWSVLPSPFMGAVTLQGALTHERTMGAGVLFVVALILTAAADRLLVARAKRAAQG